MNPNLEHYGVPVPGAHYVALYAVGRGRGRLPRGIERELAAIAMETVGCEGRFGEAFMAFIGGCYVFWCCAPLTARVLDTLEPGTLILSE